MNELSQSQVNELLADAMIERIEQLEELMLDCQQVDIPVTSLFTNGMYAREITIPKGTLLTGRVHLFDYVDIMLSGDISIATAEGAKRFSGANVFQGVAGRKRAGYAHEDTRWVTVHKTDILDAQEFVNKLTVQTMKQYNNLLESLNDRSSNGNHRLVSNRRSII